MGKVSLRADHVGSLLRSDEVKNARKSFYEEHTIDKSELTEIENQSIKALITNQENILSTWLRLMKRLKASLLPSCDPVLCRCKSGCNNFIKYSPFV